MYKSFFIALLLISSMIHSFAQNSGVSVELHYPLMSANENNNYSDVSGLFGAAFQFQFTDHEVFNYGVEYKFDLNQSFQRYEGSPGSSFNFMMNQINGFGKVNIDALKKTKIYTNAGFVFYKYKDSQYQPGFTGFNIGGGLSYEFIEKFYAQISYNYIHAGLKQRQTGFVDVENFSALRMGIGFKI